MKLHVTIGGEDVTLELSGAANAPLRFAVDGKSSEAEVRHLGAGAYSILLGGRSFDVRVGQGGGETLDVSVNGVTHHVAVRDPRRWTPGGAAGGATGPQRIKAQMPGKVVKLLVGEGDAVEAGQGVVIVEAMKMQNEMKSPRAGTVTAIKVAEGGSVAAGETLVVVD